MVEQVLGQGLILLGVSGRGGAIGILFYKIEDRSVDHKR
jgi:hypothetical protein